MLQTIKAVIHTTFSMTFTSTFTFIHAIFVGPRRAAQYSMSIIVSMSSVMGVKYTNHTPGIVYEPNDLILANHQSWFDAIVSFNIMTTEQRLIQLCARSGVRRVPGIGWWLVILGWPVLGRTPADRHRLTKHCGCDPVVIFPEGTRFTSANHASAKVFAAKNGIECGDRTILPRSGGAYSLMMNPLRKTIHIMTSIYDKNRVFPYNGHFPTDVDCITRSYKREEIPLETETEFRDWLRLRFLDMDADFKQ